MKQSRQNAAGVSSVICVWIAGAFACGTASADVITDWNVTTGDIVTEAELPGPMANRALALVQTAAYEAANAITRRYPADAPALTAASDASVEAAIAAAHRVTLTQLIPTQQAAIERAYQGALGKIADSPSLQAGIAVGEAAGAAVLARRTDDGASTPESYRPHTTAGTYIVTTLPVFSQWPQRKPWLMTSAAQFRPGPPPALTSERWARDYNEIKSLGAKQSTTRSEEQTAIARFWETTSPTVYHGVVRSVALAPGRDITQNAHLFAAVTQAVDDAAIAVFDAKYHYGFWRPITAIRNGDIDNNAATERDASWTPFITTPLHPEYPCAHCIFAATVGTVLKAEIGNGPQPTLSTTSTTANGATRSWSTVDDLIQEVSNARIYDGVHYRNSTEVGTAMGRQIGALAAARFYRK